MKTKKLMNHHSFFMALAGAASLVSTTAQANICDTGLGLNADTWTMISIPCVPPAAAPSVSDQFDADLLGTYGTDYIMYKLNASGGYDTVQGTDPLEQGIGYWIYSLKEGTLTITGGTDTTSNVASGEDDGYHTDCTTFGMSGACYKVSLRVPGPESWASNMLGVPFQTAVNWADVHVAKRVGTAWTDVGVPGTTSAADYFYDVAQTYNGAGWDENDSVDTGFALQPDVSYWMYSTNLPGDATDIALLIPDPTPPAAEPAKVIFVSSTAYTGDLDGLAGADAKCQEHANAVPALGGGEFKAWLSDDTTSASSRLTHANVNYKNVNGDVIATDWSDLTDGVLAAPVKYDERGNVVSGGSLTSVWTATLPNGQPVGPNCSNWQSVGYTAMGTVGLFNEVDTTWSYTGSTFCYTSLHLYCIEQ